MALRLEGQPLIALEIAALRLMPGVGLSVILLSGGSMSVDETAFVVDVQIVPEGSVEGLAHHAISRLELGSGPKRGLTLSADGEFLYFGRMIEGAAGSWGVYRAAVDGWAIAPFSDAVFDDLDTICPIAFPEGVVLLSGSRMGLSGIWLLTSDGQPELLVENASNPVFVQRTGDVYFVESAEAQWPASRSAANHLMYMRPSEDWSVGSVEWAPVLGSLWRLASNGAGDEIAFTVLFRDPTQHLVTHWVLYRLVRGDSSLSIVDHSALSQYAIVEEFAWGF